MSNYESKQPDANGFIQYTDEEHEVWSILIKRQKELIVNRACDEYIAGVELLDFPEDRVPQHTEVTKRLSEISGWGVEPVPAVIPAKDFFTLLANKRFPAASFVRRKEELDYLQEPDLFHEFFGHCPLLTHPAYAKFMEDYGKLALSVEPKQRNLMFRLFWFTIEFGLIHTEKGLRIFGGGILSSKGETLYALDSDVPERRELDVLTALRTPFRIDIIQPIYYILESMDSLFTVFEGDILSKVDEALKLGSFAPKFEPKKKVSSMTPEDEIKKC